MANRGLRDLARGDWTASVLAEPETVRSPLTRGQVDPPARLLPAQKTKGFPLPKPTSCMCFETLSGVRRHGKTDQ